MNDELLLEDEQFNFEFESGGAPSLVRARILWPALGFPGVIAPRSEASKDPLDRDATRSICVLVLSSKNDLTSQDAARYLRYVPWSARMRRSIRSGESGSFAPADLTVRSNLTADAPVDDAKLAEVFQFGGDRKGQNRVTVSLAQYVRRFYQLAGLRFLHEIRVSEQASGRLADGQYQLFWNKEEQDEKNPSDEMTLLLERFAGPRRKSLGAAWSTWLSFFYNEYKYEYGALHAPYKDKDTQLRLTEVLHPLFVLRNLPASLRIGHVTDTHVDVRADVYERNLRTINLTYKGKPVSYNNWNKSFVNIYNASKRDTDIVLLTGDLIDYGRGHIGDDQAGRHLGEDGQYHQDRNWFLFYYLLASRESYTQPVYTILGNHDWRLNPYPPFAPGTPDPRALIHNHQDFVRNGDDRDLKELLKIAHGPGHEKAYAYSLEIDSRIGKLIKSLLTNPKTWWDLAKGSRAALTGQFNVPGSPVQTTVESVAWYLMLINPFFDYRFALPGGHQILMLDWAKDEEVMNFDEPKSFLGFGQRALNSLTSIQRWHVDQFTNLPGKAKLIGMHAPPVGPYPNWYDEDLRAGEKSYQFKEDSRVRKPDGTILRLDKHTLLAIRRPSDPYGVAADQGSFTRNRDWFLRKVVSPGSGVRAVLSGHIHRNGIYVTYAPDSEPGALVVGDLRGSRLGRLANPSPYPLYVNTTSAGPRGDEYLSALLSRAPENAPPNRSPGYGIVVLSNDGKIQVRHVP